MTRRPLITLAVALAIACAPAGEAMAFNLTVINSGQTIVFSGTPGEVNSVTVTLAAGEYTFEDTTATAGLVGPPCTGSPGSHTVTCPAAGVTSLSLNLGDMGDTAVVTPDTRSVIRGEEGGDDLTGGGGPDQLDGDEGDDTLNGGAGNDELNAETVAPSVNEVPGLHNSLDGGAGDDALNGGGGEDTMQGGSGADTLRGSAGVDTLDGGADADAITGGSGNDTMRGGSGDDEVGDDALLASGEPPDLGNDTLEGGPGNDSLQPGSGPTLTSDNDILRGGEGFDSVLFQQRAAPVNVSIDDQPNDGAAGEADNVSTDVERLVGGQAEDMLVGSPSGDNIDGFTGADTIRGGAGPDTLDGGVDDAESDNVAGGAGDDQVRGNAGDDALAGDEGTDVVEGGGGDDRANGGDGGDNVMGGAGTDAVAGGAGDDTVDGSAVPVGFDGGDTVNGGAGDDTLEGGDGNDTLAGGPGEDDMSGELGRDTVDYASAGSDVVVTLDDSDDDGERREGDNVHRDVENVSGGGVQDTFTGSGKANTLDGGTGQDYVDGERGRDRLLGGAAVDVIRARDGKRDVIDCGQSTDFAIVDRMDRLRRCERSDPGGGSPTVGQDVVVSPASKGVQFGPPEATRTVPLLDRVQVPVASFLDTRRGAARLTAAGDRRSRWSALLQGARFSVTQRRRRGAITDLSLKGGNFRQCRVGRGRGQAMSSQVSRRRIRRLRMRAHGRFRTRGRGSSNAIRGTIVTITDRCDGTLTRVRRGVVVVRDFRLRRTIIVRAGESYLAKVAAP